MRTIMSDDWLHAQADAWGIVCPSFAQDVYIDRFSNIALRKI